MHWRTGDAIMWIIKSLLIPVAIFFLIFVLPVIADSAPSNSAANDNIEDGRPSLDTPHSVTKAGLGEELHGSFVKASVIRIFHPTEGLHVENSFLADENLYGAPEIFIAVEYLVENRTPRNVSSFRAPNIFITLESGSPIYADSMGSEILRAQSGILRPRNFEIAPLGSYRDFLVFFIPRNVVVDCIMVEFSSSIYCVDPILNRSAL